MYGRSHGYSQWRLTSQLNLCLVPPPTSKVAQSTAALAVVGVRCSQEMAERVLAESQTGPMTPTTTRKLIVTSADYQKFLSKPMSID